MGYLCRLTLRSKGRCAIKPRSAPELERSTWGDYEGSAVENTVQSIVCPALRGHDWGRDRHSDGGTTRSHPYFTRLRSALLVRVHHGSF
jgi:hypothetical protein